jgi:hypothetical protein
MRLLFRHATFARRNTFLQEAADFFLDPLFPQGPFLQLLAALRGQIPTRRLFLCSPTGISEVSRLGIS